MSLPTKPTSALYNGSDQLGTNPGVIVGTARVLFCFGKSRDMAGQGEAWAVDCEERN